MKTCVAVVLFVVLWGGRPGLIRAVAPVFAVNEGENVTVGCAFYFGTRKKIFCKNDCNKEEDILVETSANSGRNGRYSTEYEYNFPNPDRLYVSITDVRRSDSGRYQCVVEKLIKNSFQEFRIEVISDTTSLSPHFTVAPPEQSLTPGPVSSENPRTELPSEHNTSESLVFTSVYTVTTTEQSLTLGPLSSENYRETESNPNPPSGFLLLLLLIPVVMVIVSVLFIYKKRKLRNDHESTRKSEVVMSENFPAPASEQADSTYQSLSVDTRDHNQIYSSLSTQHSAHSEDYCN